MSRPEDAELHAVALDVVDLFGEHEAIAAGERRPDAQVTLAEQAD
jgi:hypothetical protein